MPAAFDPRPPVRAARAGGLPAPRDPLGRDALQAFEAYFAAEQANLEALGQSVDEDPEVAAFHGQMLSSQRRNLAELSFRVASMLPDTAIWREAGRTGTFEVPLQPHVYGNC